MYAQRTKVTVDKTRSEIENLLKRNGADGFVFGMSGGHALLVFEMKQRRLKFLMPMPSAKRADQERKVAQENRRRWRALLLVLKAKLEAVESGIVLFDEEFLAHIVVQGGATVGDRIIPSLQDTITGGNLPPLLTAGG